MKRFLRWSAFLFLGLFVCALLLIAFTPTILSTERGKEFFLSQINKSISGRFELDTLSLSWSGGQEVTKIRFTDAHNKPLFSCERITTSAPLWKLLVGKPDVGVMQIVAPYVEVDNGSSKTAASPSAGKNGSFSAPKIPALPFKGQLRVSKGEAKLTLAGQSPILFKEIEINSDFPESGFPLLLTVQGKSQRQEEKGSFSLQASVKEGVVSLNLDAAAADFSLHAEAQTLQEKFDGTLLVEGKQIPLAWAAPFLGEEPSKLLGPKLNFQLRAKGNEAQNEIALSAETLYLKAPQMVWSFKEGLLLTAPASCTLLPSPALDLPIMEPIKFNLESVFIPLQGDKIETTASIAIPSLNWISGNKRFHINLKESRAQVRFNPRAVSLFIGFASQLTVNKEAPGVVKGELTLDQLRSKTGYDLAHATLDLHMTLQGAPTALLEPWTGGPIAPLLGPEANLECALHSSLQSQQVSFTVKTQTASLDGALAFKDGGLQLQSGKPLKATLLMTPDGYRALDRLLFKPDEKTAHLQLSAPSVIVFSIDKLYLPATFNPALPVYQRFPVISNEWPQLQADAAFEIDSLALGDAASAQTLSLRGLSLKVKKPLSRGSLSFNLTGSVSDKSNSGLKEGRLSVQGSFDQLLGEKGRIDLKNLATSLDIDLQHFPTVFLDLAIRAFNKEAPLPSGLIGPTLHASLHTKVQNWNGPIDLNVNATHARASLVGKIVNGTLTLDESIYAQLLMTPELSSFLLKRVNPLSISAITAKNPMSLEVDAKGFSFPLFPYDVSRLTIPNATLEFGQISCKNAGNLNTTLRLLKSERHSKDQNLKLWFAPIVIHMHEGKLECERTEILLADTFEIATWGKIDLVNDYIDMILGLTAQCLQKAFGIKDLPENYVLQIPIRGKSGDVDIDTKRATAKIALLIAWQQRSLAGGIAKGPAGALLGELIDHLAKLPDKDSYAPPPKHPFPWETAQGRQERETSAQPPKKKAIKSKDKPLKQILKLLR